MDYNYHAHTVYCSHATGTAEEYIQFAIAGGIRYMGFSDHIPLRYPDGYESGYRVPYDKGQEYVDSIKELREKYAGQLELLVGFEMEYYPAYFEQMLQTAKDLGGEYLILGHHFLGPEHPNGHGVTHETNRFGDLLEYVDSAIEGLETGVFSYMAHPDSLFFTGSEQQYEKHMRRLCIKARELDIPLELNFLGMRRGRHYPAERFWKIAGEVGVPVTFGCDAHAAQHACPGETLETAIEWVRRFKLNYIGRPKIRKL